MTSSSSEAAPPQVEVDGSSAFRSTEFCGRCFGRLSEAGGPCPACACAGDTASAPTPLTVQGVSDRIADTIGLERIDGFDGRSFFSDLLRRRTPEEVEAHFAFGFPGHVPDPPGLQAEWPRPWAFLRVLAAGLACFLVFDVGYELFANSNLLPGLIVTGSFAAPLAMVVFFYEMNVPRNISIYHLVRLFMLGGVASLFLALLIGAVLPIGSLIGAPAAGVTEEAAKLVVVAVALRRMRLGPRPPLLNAMLIGAAVGAGFAAFESAGYAFRVLLGELPGVTVVDVILLRGVLSPFGHVAWTAIAAAALWRVSDTGRLDGSRLTDPRFLKLFALAVVLHAAWDFDLPLPFGAKFVVLASVAVVAVLSLLQQGVRAMGVPGAVEAHANA